VRGEESGDERGVGGEYGAPETESGRNHRVPLLCRHASYCERIGLVWSSGRRREPCWIVPLAWRAWGSIELLDEKLSVV
jgi:hypothetical protein